MNRTKSSIYLTEGFWKNRQEINRKITIHAVWDRFCATGRVSAFQCDWKPGMPNQPHVYWDSDVAKWMEATAYLIGQQPDAELEQRVEWLIDRIAENQWEDGYFNITYTVCPPGGRFTRRDDHELYCAGHLIEAAVAYFEATGRDRFLRLMMRYADCIERIFVHEQSASFVTLGHEEIELALVRLYRATGLQKYLRLCAFFIDQRGANKKDGNTLYRQDQLPVREQREAEGHAVRALYLYCGMADLTRETGDAALADACRALFADVTRRKMYITGGAGSTHHGEAFTVAYDLPNETAYAETCASIALAFFCRRMLSLEKKGEYGDVMERALYNGVLAGISLDGKAFFYENPLEITLRNHTKYRSTEEGERLPITQRKEVFDCSCCPPNLNRLFASLEDYLYDYADGTLYIHQFAGSTAQWGNAGVTVATRYPADGAVHIQPNGIHTLYVRIPGWCTQFTCSAPHTLSDGYACIQNPGDHVDITFEMRPVLMQASSAVWQDNGLAALQYGPLVYCAEGCDNGDNLHALYIDRRLHAQAVYEEEYGAPVLHVQGWRRAPGGALYSPLDDAGFEQAVIRCIPYFAFANRGPSDMLVWMNIR